MSTEIGGVFGDKAPIQDEPTSALGTPDFNVQDTVDKVCRRGVGFGLIDIGSTRLAILIE